MQKFTFDGVNKLFIADPGITEFDIQQDLYSDWKEELLLPGNLKYAQALRTVGGDPVTAERDLGDTYFLLNGWRIRPQEADHRLEAEGNLYTDPFGFSAYVQVTGTFNVMVESTVSNLVDSTIARLEIENLQFLIESQRASHSAYGDIFYWDPENGDDSNDGTTSEDGVKTWAVVHDLCTDGNHDLVIALATAAAAPTEVDDQIIITKNYLFVRGSGRDFHIHPNTTGSSGVIIRECEGSEVSGMIICAGLSGTAVRVDKADFVLLETLWVEDSTGCGIVISGSRQSQILYNNIEHNAEEGIIFLDGCEEPHLFGNHIEDNGSHGVDIRGGRGVHLEINHIHDNQGYGVRIGPAAVRTEIKRTNNIFHNGLGAVLDLGTRTYIETRFGLAQDTRLRELHAIQGLQTGTPPLEISEDHRMVTGTFYQTVEADTPASGTVRVTRTE
ncbi:hypothetical protein LCGC14_1486970 [marine sediment metagenome]|uniref:Right handed beta helix domain-containing protein n=1 Tax=marine sediment metagenome TaxID=412755 RepID=A0A0F9M9S8_9ZZZZ